ncbi:EsaB/YukD family protein [Enterococcus faecalis]|uniref:Type VII secretion protein, YukD family n=1 Tax=Enterococcus faecalis RP2S-4 TaxID=1244145 RepID=A0ABC9THJ4_ENTFL|nr:EsaB/YukD family protein [Enterococcus faecalis]EPI04814.1 type VII secretion protein, YukD family [Enterococcus faecalis RP2S-4]
MNKGTSISIGLQVGNQIVDLQIPNQVSVARLKELLLESFELLPNRLPASFELVVLNKPIHLADNQLIVDYPLGNGDQLLVKETVKEINE